MSEINREALAQAMAEADRVAYLCAMKPWDQLSDGRKESYFRHADAVFALIQSAAYGGGTEGGEA